MRISRSALALCLVLGTSSTAWAQGGGGVILGVNFADLEFTGDDAPDYDRRTGIAAGIFFNMPLGQALSVQPEVLYSQKGAKIGEGDTESTIEVDYLDVPVLARMTAGGTSGLVVFAGPSFGFKIRARTKTEIIDGESEEIDIDDDVESFDLGVVVGAGIQGGKFLLDGRYQWGLSNANKDQIDDTEVKNRVLSIVLGIRF